MNNAYAFVKIVSTFFFQIWQTLDPFNYRLRSTPQENLQQMDG